MLRTFRTLVLLGLLVSVATAAPARRRPIYGDVPLDRYLHGKVLEMKGRKVRIAYDFSDPEQYKDFYYKRPFRKAATGSSRCARPSRVPSKRLVWVSSQGVLVRLSRSTAKPSRS